jgi:hypothetical protein
MSDIFVSYDAEDRDRVLPLVQALESTGWTIFWDRTIPAGTAWRQRMDAEIKTCRSVLVVWTEKSVNSEWVIEEAEIGKRRHILVPVLLDEIEPPFGFGMIQAANLIAWNGSIADPSFDRLVSDIAAILGPVRAKAQVIEQNGGEGEGQPEGVKEEGGSRQGKPSRTYEKSGRPAEDGDEEKTSPFLRALTAGATKSADWFKRITGIFLATLIVSVSLIVLAEVGLGWDLNQAEISVIVLFVWVVLVVLTTQRARWKWKPIHLLTKLRSHRSLLFTLATAATGLSLFACVAPAKLSLAAESNQSLIVSCVPHRPVAYPGERIGVTAWTKALSDKSKSDVTWTSSVGSITGKERATWTFPNDDAKVSVEVPATAKALVRHATLGRNECEARVYFVRRVVLRGDSGTPLLSGRTFLLSGKREPEGYGLYSYILFGSPPGNDTERERSLKAIESYLQVVQPIEELGRYRDPHELNITLIPLKIPIDLNRNVTEPKQARELAIKLLGIYDYARAQVLLADFGLDATSSGPFLVSKRLAPNATQADRTVFDMSRVSPTLVWQHTKAFCNLATQESTWTETTLRRFALNVRNVIAVAARITPQVKGEVEGLLPGAR